MNILIWMQRLCFLIYKSSVTTVELDFYMPYQLENVCRSKHFSLSSHIHCRLHLTLQLEKIWYSQGLFSVGPGTHSCVVLCGRRGGLNALLFPNVRRPLQITLEKSFSSYWLKYEFSKHTYCVCAWIFRLLCAGNGGLILPQMCLPQIASPGDNLC